MNQPLRTPISDRPGWRFIALVWLMRSTVMALLTVALIVGFITTAHARGDDPSRGDEPKSGSTKVNLKFASFQE